MENSPEQCEHEGKSCGTKSECRRYGKWTNCREVGYCTLCPTSDEKTGEDDGH